MDTYALPKFSAIVFLTVCMILKLKIGESVCVKRNLNGKYLIRYRRY